MIYLRKIGGENEKDKIFITIILNYNSSKS